MRKRTIANRIAECLKGKGSMEQDARRKEDLRRAGMDAERLSEYESLLRDIDEMEVPEPSVEMGQKFKALLEDVKKAQFAEAKPAGRTPGLFHRLTPGLFPRFAVGLCLLVVGWFLGYRVTPRPEQAQLNLLASEVREMKKTVMLSKLKNPSAAERMIAVGFAQDLSKPDDVILAALIQTLNEDPNVNVRLASVEALSRYAGRPQVREALVQAIVRQESPLVQLALADLMLTLNEKRAVEPFRQVLANPLLDYSVKARLENMVRQLL